MKTSLVAAAWSASMIVLAPMAQAEPTTQVFGDRSSFLAALLPGAYAETFDTGAADFQPTFSYASGSFAYTVSAGGTSGVYTDGNFVGNLDDNSTLVLTFTAGSPLAVGGSFFVSDSGDALVPGASVTFNLDNGFSHTFTPTGSADFRGFVSDTPIASLVLTAPGAGRFNSLDNLVVGVVPEPASWLLMALGVAGLCARRLRARTEF